MKRFLIWSLTLVMTVLSGSIVGCGVKDETKADRIRDMNPQVERVMRSNERRRSMREEMEQEQAGQQQRQGQQ